MPANPAPILRFHAARALLPHGWARDVRILSQGGALIEVTEGASAEPGDTALAIALPGLGNLHSHAFQRGMAGLTEIGGNSGDSFWSWRELMYRFLAHLQPEAMQAIAEQAYVEMLESGFTRVGEFHYLHHGPDGVPYANRAEMAERIAAAAHSSGIGLTLLPVFYAHADFGGAAPNPAQRRLIHDVDGFAELLQGCTRAAGPGRCGARFRPAQPARGDWRGAVGAAAAQPGPVHIHIAEQTREVDACVAWSGMRPVQWLYEHAPVDARWCLVHATHITDAEMRQIIASRAVAGLCPITEANLGDGLFPMQAFARAGGRFGVGSDSNVLIDAAEELRLLEYGQRLQLRGRNVLAPGDGQSTGRWLYEQSLNGAAQALGVSTGLQAGAPADLVELDPDHPALIARDGDALLDSWVFAARNGAVRSVWRQGRQLVRDGRHPQREAVAARFAAALRPLLGV